MESSAGKIAVWTRDVNRDLRYTAVSNAGFDIFRAIILYVTIDEIES